MKTMRESMYLDDVRAAHIAFIEADKIKEPALMMDWFDEDAGFRSEVQYKIIAQNIG